MTDRQKQIEELILSKLDDDGADSGWVVAYAMSQALPVLRDFTTSLDAINKAIAPAENGRSVVAELRLILGALTELVEKHQ